MYVLNQHMDHSPDALPDADFGERLRWLFRRRKRFTVTGASMFPILKPGDQVLLDPRAYVRKPPAVGDIVVAVHPARRDLKIIKRVTRVLADGTLNLEGENIFETTDFRRVPASTIVGKVTSIFFRAE